MAGVRLDGIGKRFGSLVAVDSVNLDICDGEFLVLLGPSGCGKSTVLRMIAGLEEVSSGNLYIGERRVNDVAAKDRDIAMVFQSYALYPHMNAYDNMAFSLKLRGIPKGEIDKQVQAVAEMLELGALLKRKPRELSGGQRQRVALGRAIVRKPKVFLMDEPLSNLDAKLRLQTRAELVRLHNRLRTTTIYVTHDQVEAMTMGNRIAVMNKGVLQQVASPTVLYHQPANMFVAGFIGSPSMNFFPAELARDGDGLFAESPGLRIRFSPEQARQVEGRAKSGSVVIGVRPEDVIYGLREGEAAGATRAEATVDVVEQLGAEQLVYVALDGKMIVARVGADVAAKPEDRVTLGLRQEKLHVFDAGTEEALL